jgi:acyl-CoA reductase-like NAD-dependent aldehyde dehydrogenase
MPHQSPANIKCQTLNDKREALLSFAKQLRDKSFQEHLITAYMQDTGFLRKNIIKREIEVPLNLINMMLNYIDVNYDKLNRATPKGKVAILLPSNGINMMIAKAVCASFLAGNETIVKLPRKLKHSNELFRGLVSSNLYNTYFESDEKSSETFLKEVIASAYVKAIVIYGDDKWIWGYKNLVRRTDTKLIFEGPGKDPMIIMPDANVDLAVNDAISGCLLNGGQSCSALERFFIHTSLVEEFCEKLIGKLTMLTVGHPTNEDADIGPINSNYIIERLNKQIDEAVFLGAKVLLGGKTVEIDGCRGLAYLPTVLANCDTNMKIVKEENFAPVFPIIMFETEEELLCKVDDCNYGLNASAYGSISKKLSSYLLATHRNVYFDSTVTSPCNQALQACDGGFKSSGFIWMWENEKFLQLEGKRNLTEELSN